MHVIKHLGDRVEVSFSFEEFDALKRVVGSDLEKTPDGCETEYSFGVYLRWHEEELFDSKAKEYCA